MDKALLDTDIFSEMFKAVDPKVIARANAYRTVFGRYTISVVTVMEVIKGFHRLRREARIQQFLNNLTTIEVLTLEIDAAETAGRIYADLERSGQPIGHADPMIAAIALRHDLTLVTGNEAHYQRIQGLGYGLKLDNWRR